MNITDDNFGFNIDENWKLAIKKTILVISCSVVAFFIVVLLTISYYFIYSSLNDKPQEFPGMEPWESFWFLGMFMGFLIGMFKSISDILDEKMHRRV